MKPTPWIKSHTAVTSDLLAAPNRPGKKGKGRDAPKKDGVPSPKSKEVQRIERLLSSLETGLPPAGVGREGCFCKGIPIVHFSLGIILILTWSKARTHELSNYTPMCPHCGLILCVRHYPNLPCPYCHSPVLSPSASTALVAKLQGELSVIRQKEEDAREEANQERLQRELEAAGGGSFPALASTTSVHTPLAPTTRKVLSLNSKTKKVTVSSFSPTPRPASTHSASQSKAEDDEFAGGGLHPSVPCPPDQPPFAIRKGTERRWENLRGGGPLYVQPPRAVHANVENDSTKKRRKQIGKVPVPEDAGVQKVGP